MPIENLTRSIPLLLYPKKDLSNRSTGRGGTKNMSGEEKSGCDSGGQSKSISAATEQVDY